MPFHRLLLLALLVCGLRAGDPAPDFGPSVVPAKGDPAVNLATLRGKVAILVFFQSWCPVCNEWAPGFVQQMEEAYGSDPRVVLVAVKTDGDAAGGKDFLKGKGANLDRWLVLSDTDAAYVTRLLGKDELWQYAVIRPDGSLAESGKAGSYFPNGGKKDFVLPDKNFGSALGAQVRPFLAGTYPEALTRAVRLAEANLPVEAITAAAASGDAQAKAFRDEVLATLGERIEAQAAILADSAQTADARMIAYEDLARQAQALKGSEPGKVAAKAVSEAGKDKALKGELAALKAWTAMQAKLAQVPADQAKAAIADAYPRFIKAHEGTAMAARAQAALGGG